ncbi:NucA/NucB deoxyribonuclease domain-containing protein [Spirillospora sp. NPDC049652]
MEVDVARRQWFGGLTALIVLGGVLVPATAAGALDRSQARYEPMNSPAEAQMQPATQLGASGRSAPRTCFPKPNRYNRTQSCSVRDETLKLTIGGHELGRFTYRITQTTALSVKSTKFTEHVNFRVLAVRGDIESPRLTFGSRCKSPCRAGISFPQNRVLRRGTSLTGTVSYSVKTGKGKIYKLWNNYSWTFRGTNVPAATLRTRSVTYRCDNALNTQGAGCVYPGYIPVMTAMKKLPQIAANIRRVQSRGNHYGRPGSGRPLHRMMDRKKQVSNRRAVCRRAVVGPPPRPGVSCDEYPFASTAEGGTALSRTDRGTAWVPVAEQDSQRGLITGSHTSQRVLDGDPFYVGV